MAGYFTIDFVGSNASQTKVLELVSHDGYKKKVTITFSITTANNPAPYVSTPTGPIKVSLDEDETEFVDATIAGMANDSGTLHAYATDGMMSDTDDIFFQFPP